MQALKLIWLWLQVAGGAMAALAICWLATQAVFHLRLLNVQTGSMAPAFRPGDALIMQRIDAAQLRPGMIVSYKSARNPTELVTHRVVQVNGGSFGTKGDALNAPDPVVRNNLLVGREVAVLPGMGKPLGWLTTWPGMIVCVYIPAGAMVISELYRLERSYKSRSMYRLSGA